MTEADSADPLAFAVHVRRDAGLHRVMFVPRVKCSTHVLCMQRGRSCAGAASRLFADGRILSWALLARGWLAACSGLPSAHLLLIGKEAFLLFYFFP